MKFFHAFVIAPLLVVAPVTPTKFPNCGDISKPLTFEIVGCDLSQTDELCVLKAGGDIAITITFQLTELQDDLYLYFKPFDWDQNIYYDDVYYENVCDILVHDSCPLKMKEYTIKTIFPIIKFFPQTWMYLAFGISRMDSPPIACSKVPIFISK